jgi:hypothetical protein
MQQAAGWNPIEADDGWYIDDVRVSNAITSAATVSVDTADRSGLPVCGPVCSSVTASLVVTPPIMECSDRTVTLDASGSTTDQCPGGVLQYRFQWQYFTNWEEHAGVIQDWNESPFVSHTMGNLVFYGPFPYRVDVRCSTLPACQGTATTRVPMHFQPVPFPYSISFLNKTTIDWGSNLYFAAVSGDLNALRANGGNFQGTGFCLAYVSPGDGTRSSMVDFTLPTSSGKVKYYLLRRVASAVPDCSINSYSTGAPAEVPGAGANRMWTSRSTRTAVRCTDLASEPRCAEATIRVALRRLGPHCLPRLLGDLGWFPRIFSPGSP